MQYYFTLQIKRLHRYFRDWGVVPFWGYAGCGALFVTLSILFFQKIPFAPYAYTAFALLFVLSFNSKNTIIFFRLCYSEKVLRKINFIQNNLLIIPFILFLLYKKEYVLIIILIIFTNAIMPFGNRPALPSIVVPTPFSKEPFEFTSGFRNTFYLILLNYVLTVISVAYSNANLCLFTIILVIVICISYFQKVEAVNYVTIFNLSPQKFLLYKCWTALKYAAVLTLPIFVCFLIAFPHDIYKLIFIVSIAFCYLFSFVFLKYLSFPKNIKPIHFLILSISIIYAPVVPIIMIIFYFYSFQNLKNILDDKSRRLSKKI